MKSIYLQLGIVALLIGASLTSCQKNNSTSPTVSLADSTDLSFGVQSDSFISTFTFSKPGGSGFATNAVVSQEAFAWTAGVANISKFKLEATRDGVPLEIQSNNLTNVDLFALTPLLSKVNIKKGLYTNVELRVVLTHAAPGAALPLVLTGVFTSGGGTHWPVEFDFNEDLEIKASVADITVDGTQSLLTKLNMHLAKFLTSITAQQVDATTRTNGSIIISSTSNAALYAKIKANLLISSDSKFEHHEKGK